MRAMDMAFHARPFGFDRIFADAPARMATLTEDEDPAMELEIARRELARQGDLHRAELARARADGFEAGLAQARLERDAALLAAVDALHAGIEAMADEMDQLRAEARTGAAGLALAAARHIAAHALDTVPGAAIEAAIGRALAQVPRGTELTVRVHPDLVADIEARIAARQAADRRRLNLHAEADPGLPVGDARIEWDAGGLALDAGRREAALIREIDALLAPPAAPQTEDEA